MAIIIDSHCHPQFPKYDEDRDTMIQRALDAGIKMICIGTDLESSRAGIELAQKYEGMWATVGVHPNEESGIMNQESWAELLKHSKVVAIGEIGLDYYRTPEIEKQEKQKQVFKQFLELALEHNKPVVIHARDSAKGSTGKVHSDMISILTNHYSLLATSYSGVAHSFTGSIDEAKKYLDLGFYLGFNGIITFPPSRKASDGQVPGMYDEMIKSIPLDRILLETDAPYLAPEPYRGKRNEPAYVIEVAEKLAELKDESLERVIFQTTQNCRQLFGI